MWRFDLATAIQDPKNLIPSDYNAISDISMDDMDKVPAPIPLARLAWGSIQTPTNYFNEALIIQKDPQASWPFQMFADNGTAFHLLRIPASSKCRLIK